MIVTITQIDSGASVTVGFGLVPPPLTETQVQAIIDSHLPQALAQLMSSLPTDPTQGLWRNGDAEGGLLAWSKL